MPTAELLNETPILLADATKESAKLELVRAKKIATNSPELPSIRLTLPEVRVSAVQNNLDLRVAEFDPAVAQEAYRGEFGKFESIFSAAVSPAGSFDSRGNQKSTTALDPRISVPTRAGGFVSIGLPFSTFRDATGQPLVPPSRTYTAEMDVSVSQPLLRNAGFQINYASINILGLAMRQADARTKLAAIRILANAEQAYWNYYAAYENLKVQVEQYDLAEEQLVKTERRAKFKEELVVEVAIADSNASRRLAFVVQAELVRRIAERRLKKIINRPDLPVESKTIIIPATPPTPTGFSFDRAEVIRLALNNRMELFDNQLQLLINQLSLEVSRNAILPDLQFRFRYSYKGTGRNPGKAFDQLFPRPFDEYSGMLFLEAPLKGNIAARAAYRQDQLQYAQTASARKALELNVREEVLNSIDAVEENWQRILANRLARNAAKKNFDGTKKRSQALGERITGNEVVFTQSLLADVEAALVLSISDYQKSLVDLAFATGTVLGKSGVVWSMPFVPLNRRPFVHDFVPPNPKRLSANLNEMAPAQMPPTEPSEPVQLGQPRQLDERDINIRN